MLHSAFDVESLDFAWGSVPLGDQMLALLQTRAPCFNRKGWMYQLRYPLLSNYCTNWARRSSWSSETPLPVLQVPQAGVSLEYEHPLMSPDSPSLFIEWFLKSSCKFLFIKIISNNCMNMFLILFHQTSFQSHKFILLFSKICKPWTLWPSVRGVL